MRIKALSRLLLIRVPQYLLLLVLMGFTILPLLWLFDSSIKPRTQIFSEIPHWIPTKVTLTHYLWAMSSGGGNLLPPLYNSIVVSFVTAFITLVLSVLGGYAISRFRFPGYSIVLGFLLVVQVFQGPVVLVPWYKLALTLGILDTKLVLVLVYLTHSLPICVLMMSGFYRSVPDELEEAAYVDGSTKFRTLWAIVAPITIPGMVSIFLYAFILSWNDYQYALVLTSSMNSETVQVALQNMVNGMGEQNWGGMLAGGTLITLPVIALFAFIQRYLIQGLTSGAIKG